MTYAPHSNNDVQHQLRLGLVPTPLPLLLGAFCHQATGVRFEYAERRWPVDDFGPEYPHIIYTIDGPRLARVLKTVAYVVVDETTEGEAVSEHWHIKAHDIYDTSWVRAD